MKTNKSPIGKEFTIDMTGVMNSADVQNNIGEISSGLKIALSGTYTPLMADFQNLHQKDNPSREERETLASSIEEYLLKKYSAEEIKSKIDIEKAPEKGTEGQLLFILQGLKNDKTLDEIMNGYNHKGTARLGVEQHFEDLFETDFNRTAPRVINQNGEEVYPDLHQTILKELGDQKNWNSSNYKKKLKEKLNLSDKQLQLYVSRVHQYSVTGNGQAFRAKDDIIVGTDRTDTIHVTTDKENKIRFEAFESTFIATKMEIKNDKIVLDEHDAPSVIPYYRTSNTIFLPYSDKDGNSSKHVPSIPSQEVRETITFVPLSPDAKYDIPPCLQNRTVVGIEANLNQAMLDNNLKKINSIIESCSDLDQTLSREALKKLCPIVLRSKQDISEKTKDKLLTSFIKKEIDQAQTLEIATDNIVNVVIGPEGLHPNDLEVLNKEIKTYNKTKKPTPLNKIVQYIQKIIKSKNSHIQTIKETLQARDQTSSCVAPASNNTRVRSR